ncbi:hypothetical protein V9T40_005337 [Parthenolecanium corni]|uniref:Uncharacterized protein n=1 Tax=Parthenolecanium corni TaxID=536013 RepID=A0AAN9TEH5_9HEMI
MVRTDRNGNWYVKVRNGNYIRIEYCLQRIEDEEIFIEGFEFSNVKNFFESPIASRKVGTVQVSATRGSTQYYNIQDVVKMCYPMPLNVNDTTKLVLTEILHTDTAEDLSWIDARSSSN